MIAVIQIMAQIGYPVPAEYATISIRDAIFTRFGSDDDLESNSSSFFREMQEIGQCLRGATEQSLVLVDELGRGTSLSDGQSISTAIFEEFVKRKVKNAESSHSQTFRALYLLLRISKESLITLNRYLL